MLRETKPVKRKRSLWYGGPLAALLLVINLGVAQAQKLGEIPEEADLIRSQQPAGAVKEKEAELIEQVFEPELVLQIDPARSKVVRTRKPIMQISITDPQVIEVTEFNRSEFEIIGLRPGESTLTIWFEGADDEPAQVLRYLVRVSSRMSGQRRAEVAYRELQARVNELFPDSQVQLIPVADKLIVRGQARDAKDAANILGLLGENVSSLTDTNLANATQVNTPDLGENEPNVTLINLLHVPGEQQVMLKVRIAELTRTAGRDLSVDFSVMETSLTGTPDGARASSASISNMLAGGAGNIEAILDNGDVELFINAFTSTGYGKILAEPNLVTLSGQTATFLAGGEFAVPTVVGVEGVGAATTTFRGFGTQLAFTPTVLDKDKIRMQVAPSFSALNEAATVDGIPGLDIRAVTTTVDLREGQWLAIAGLIQDEQGGSRVEVPYLGFIPVVGALFGNQQVRRAETELIVLVSPELVHPMEPEQVPLYLPGMEVTDPTGCAFYLGQRIEGNPYYHYRSTVWPQQKRHVRREYKDMNRAARAGMPLDRTATQSEAFYLSGPSGFSK